MMRRLVVGFGLVGSVILTAAPLPLEDFTRSPETSHVRLSPDGKSLAFLRDRESRTVLHIVDLESGKMHYIHPGYAGKLDNAPKEFATYLWVGDRRLVAATTVYDRLYGLIATDVDATNVVGLAGMEDQGFTTGQARLWETQVIHVFNDAEKNVLMLDRFNQRVGNPGRPDILRVNTMTGAYTQSEKNPGQVSAWGLDDEGVPRLGLLSRGEETGAIYREGPSSPWRTVIPLTVRRNGAMRPLGFAKTMDQVFVAALTEEKRWTVFTLDPKDGSLGGPLLTDPVYDIAPEGYSPNVDGIALAGPVFSAAKKSLVGVRYYADAPRVKWLDKDFAKYQRSLDAALPNTVNVLLDQSRDGTKLVWFAYSDQDPGTYYLMDTVKPALKKIATRRSWIKPEQMAVVRPYHYTARDGVVIRGYLTIPPGLEPKNLPLVVMPHGGPWVRDEWRFDPLAQALASRGYAVLQMDYRGSPGYGYELREKAKRQIGKEIQWDIEDATRWAIEAGVADPGRIAIAGMSYGGYSALFAAGKSPGLYRCAISVAGVTDWLEIYEDSDVATNRAARTFWKEQIGDPTKEADFFRSISPVNFAAEITIPVLIVQGKEDARVPATQAKLMVNALKKVGREPESILIPNLGHSYGNEAQRLRIYRAILDFLERHLQPVGKSAH